MDNFFLHPFANFWVWIDAPLVDMATQMSTRLFAYVRPNMKTISILFMSLTIMSSVMRSMGEDVFMRSLPALISLALFSTTFLTVPFYQKTIIYMWQHVPAGLVAAITGGQNQGGVPQIIDTSMVKSVLGGTTILESISTSMFNPMTWALMLCAVTLIFFAVMAHVVEFGGFVLLDYIMALLVGVGPIALAFGPFEKTRGITISWLACLATTVMAMGMLVGTIVMILGVEGKIAQEVINIKGGGAAAVGFQIIGMIMAAAGYLMFGWFAMKAQPLAAAIFNGVTASINTIIGAPAAAGAAGYNAARNMAGGSSSSAGSSPSAQTAASPPGRPLGRP
jgi:hypothetical protein